MYLILLGGPGAGKGTQGQMLSTYLGIPRISSGDLFREHIHSRTDLGRLAQSFIEQGALVPDDITISMVMDRLDRPDCRRGTILDGFPRTVPQAEALDDELRRRAKQISLVLDLQVAFQILIERLTGRWLCRVCGASFHTKLRPPAMAGICDFCGNTLFQREDDHPETVVQRLEVYSHQTEPLRQFYAQVGLLHVVDGGQSVEEVQRDLIQALKTRLGVG
ncbi:MAG: adenylate kinase [Anaerolineae bacterium]|nr:adenylate kinase [Anaerolineae bacterium]